jgi:hypothetical protein
VHVYGNMCESVFFCVLSECVRVCVSVLRCVSYIVGLCG